MLVHPAVLGNTVPISFLQYAEESLGFRGLAIGLPGVAGAVGERAADEAAAAAEGCSRVTLSCDVSTP
jgi:hypothetical protein